MIIWKLAESWLKKAAIVVGTAAATTLANKLIEKSFEHWWPKKKDTDEKKTLS